MSEAILYTTAIGTASAIFKRLGIAQCAQTQGMLYQLALLVLEAIQFAGLSKTNKSEQRYCPRCFKPCGLSHPRGGGKFYCSDCRQRWFSPASVDVN